jgi:hypothetical protein
MQDAALISSGRPDFLCLCAVCAVCPGYTPLHMASGYMHTGPMAALLEAGADPLIKDKQGMAGPTGRQGHRAGLTGREGHTAALAWVGCI